MEPAAPSDVINRPLPCPAHRIHRCGRKQLRALQYKLPYHVHCCNAGVPVCEVSCSLPAAAFSLAAQVRRGFSFNYYNKHFLPPYMQVGGSEAGCWCMQR